ncbi:PD-(D/E)XK nuclease family protein [uncultured Alistipes sp.]|jgi:hypothetical protein|uniref:PDDEXK-like family protein n=1 Tax=uncultured Alistipes sp. TaxID=538949 RepID=UPI0025FE0C1C|nr:PD-(D/E)XK nuclease family protein [uncultured Alistipes sp.]
MNGQLYASLLSQAGRIIQHHNQIAQLSGERFNLFKIIKLTANEVRVHSALLAELLNPRGTHGQGVMFLDLFLKYFGIQGIDTGNCEVSVEKPIGAINQERTEGGRIDLFISDTRGRCVAIENKIYAGDQDKQLIRYHNYCNGKGWKCPTLLYLTLEGRNPTKQSCGELKSGEDYRTISYRTDIVEWLEACRKECVQLPVVREGITHYINLIKLLTNQIGSKKMQNELYKLITTDPEYFEAADKLAANVNYAKHGTQWNFWKALRHKLEAKGLKAKTEEEDEKTATSTKTYRYHCDGKWTYPGLWIEVFRRGDISIHWGAEIETNFYTGFTIEYKGQGGISDQAEYAHYRDLVQKVDPGYFTDSKHWLGWKNSEPVLNFRAFNEEQMYRLADPEYLDRIVSNIADIALQDVGALQKLLSAL